MSERNLRLEEVWSKVEKGVKKGEEPDYLMTLVGDSRRLYELESEAEDSSDLPYGAAPSGPQMWGRVLDADPEYRQGMMKRFVQAGMISQRCQLLHGNLDGIIQRIIAEITPVIEGRSSITDAVALAARINDIIEGDRDGQQT